MFSARAATLISRSSCRNASRETLPATLSFRNKNPFKKVMYERVNTPPRYPDGTDPRLIKLRKIDFHYKRSYEDYPEDLEVIMLKPVEGVGSPGDVLTLHKHDARALIICKEAAYVNEENLARYQYLKDDISDSLRPSSHTALMTKKSLEKQTLAVFMNVTGAWTIEPWNVAASFRLQGVVVPADSVSLEGKVIQGPNTTDEFKEFVATVLINKKEKASIRCKLLLVGERKIAEMDMLVMKAQPLFDDQAEKLQELYENSIAKM